MADDTDTARRALDERLDRAFDGATPVQIIAAIDALIAAVRAENDAEHMRSLLRTTEEAFRRGEAHALSRHRSS